MAGIRALLGGEERLDPQLRRTMGILIVGIIAVFLDTTVVNVAIDTLAGDLHASVTAVQWVTRRVRRRVLVVGRLHGSRHRPGPVPAPRPPPAAFAGATSGGWLCAGPGIRGRYWCGGRRVRGRGSGFVTQQRADARRSRQRVLAAATDAFAAEGFAVSLAEIARRADVGTATIYRHFATKEALFEAVVHDRIRRLITEAHLLRGVDDPGAALLVYFSRVVEQVSFNKALVQAFESTVGVRFPDAPIIQRDFRAALGELLVAAQRAGQVRGDVDAADVVALAVGCIAMEHHRRSSGRMVELVCDALRPERAALPVVPLRPSLLDALREATAGPRWPAADARARRRCVECGTPIKVRRTGRAAQFCGPTCRQRAYRKRHRATGDSPA